MEIENHMGSFIPFFLLLSFNLFLTSAARDILTPSQPLVDGQTLVSSGGYFALGFFSADGGGPTSDRRYLGIWYHNVPVQKVVWVANRENPITTGILSLSPDGDLSLRNITGGEATWSANYTSGAVHNPYMTLLDSGNLVLADENSTTVWQSFDYPSHSLLPGMKIGWDLRRGLERHLTNWKADDYPSPGNSTFRLKLTASPEMELSKGSVAEYRTGAWDVDSWSGVTPMKVNSYFIFHLEMDEEKVYYSYESKNKSVISMLTVGIGGDLQRLVWLGGAWRLYWRMPQDSCDIYGTCGAYSVCQIGDVQEQCGCLKGFDPRSAADWGLRDYSGGCKRRTALARCGGGGGGDGFVKVSGVKTPDSTDVTVATAGAAGVAGCEAACLLNCSCVAFALVDGKCISWKGKLMDIKEFPTGGEDVYVRIAASDLDSLESGSGKNKPVAAIVIPLVLASIVVFCFGLYLIKRKRKHGVVDGCVKESRGKEMELPLFDMLAIESATDNFCYGNKLGEGGFGPVYKGKLGDGQDIAVKRLSRYSVQGLDEFMNEVMLIAKLQHRNLVRLLGCCIQKEERLLIYEYMPNKSLDAFIFDKANSCHLDWKKRFEIILGIARGLLYLHQDSRLKIIHRDLKVSNVLLDKEMNPKISDFGMARIFRGDQMQESTEKVVGTYGYMSPEYAMHGIFSVKSDVFSFGVIVLEILTGKKNRVFDPNEPHVSLVGHAWKLWSESRSLELVDDAMQYGYSESEVLRCMQVGLLCVQELSDDRPTMASVVLMLGSEGMLLPQPKRPGFYPREGSKLKDFSTSDHVSTGNDITLTMVHGR